MTVKHLEHRVKVLEQRNQRVELDKAWETSYTRRTLLIIFTYLSIGLYMAAIKIPSPWQSAVIPSLGFFLSTLTLPYFKSLWRRQLRDHK